MLKNSYSFGFCNSFDIYLMLILNLISCEKPESFICKKMFYIHLKIVVELQF